MSCVQLICGQEKYVRKFSVYCLVIVVHSIELIYRTMRSADGGNAVISVLSNIKELFKLLEVFIHFFSVLNATHSSSFLI